MKKIDRTVRQETLFVAAGTVLLSVLLNAVFLLIGKWNLTVLAGNLLGAVFAVLNFFLMGITVQSSVGKDEKAIKTRVKFSIIFRELMLLGVAIAGVLLPSVFNIIALLISFFFPRIVIMLRPKFKLPGDENIADNNDVSSSEDDSDETE